MKTEEIIELLVQEIAKLPEGTESTIAREVSKLGIDVTDKELFDIDYKTIEKLDEKRILLDKSKYVGQCIGLSFNIPFVVRKENYGEAVKRVTIVSMNVEELEKLCQENNAEAMNELGKRYLEGLREKHNEKKALSLFIKASKLGLIEAKINLAKCFYEGKGTEKNDYVAFDIYKELADAKVYDPSLYYLAQYYFYGGPVEIDTKKAYEYYNKAYEHNKNNLDAKWRVAISYYVGKYFNEKNSKKAFEMMNELANAGFGKAYYYLADMYYYGDGVERDYKKAQENLEKSVIKKEFVYDSRYRLGMMYLEGKSKEIDYSKADQYFREILDENYDDAYYKLAYVLEKYEKEGKEAKQYYEKIELDFCMLLIYYMLSYKDTANMNELKELLNLSRIELKNSALNDWLKKYYDRLSYLSDEEYQEIVSRVESKMQNKKKIDFSKIASDEDVKQVAKKIIK